MPRVTQDHLDARRQQILDAASRCFTRNGFHATSMPDIFAEAQLSSGAVYRYFAGKHAIIEALAESTLRPVLHAVRDAASAEPPLTVAEIIGLIQSELAITADRDATTSLVVQVWAESARDQGIRASYRKASVELHASIMALIRRLHPRRRAHADTAWAVISLSMGIFLCQTLVQEEPSTTESLVDQLGILLSDPVNRPRRASVRAQATALDPQLKR
jgi:AcrR family transcriptional regulator